MNSVGLAKLSNDALVALFREYALETSKVLLDSDVNAANRLYRKMEAINTELKPRGPKARKALVALFDDDDLRVRFEAARRCVGVTPERALNVIKQVEASHFMPVAGEAGMDLYFIETGIGKLD